MDIVTKTFFMFDNIEFGMSVSKRFGLAGGSVKKAAPGLHGAARGCLHDVSIIYFIWMN